MLRPRTVTLPGGIRQTTETRVVENVLLPFIRSRKVYFRMQGLIANTRHRPFFDGVDVSNWVREEPFLFASEIDADIDLTDDESGHPEGATSLISDSDGVIEGSFYVPNNSSLRFRAGRREFKVLDWNATSDDNAISKAFAAYTAQGTLETQETTVTTIRPAPPTPPPVVRFRDPVAQSFQIEKPEGCFVTSVNVYMQSKSASVPLQVEIRPVVNGLPTNTPVPGAAVFIPASQVNISESPDVNDASTATKATFDAPVYLEGFTEYAVVVLAESDDYNIWTAVTTEFVVGSTTKRIMKQPAMGSFFKSQNGSTWTPDQSRDMMFRLYRAKFNTSGAAYLQNADVPWTKGVLLEVLETGASPKVRVHARNHSMTVGADTQIAKAVDGLGITAAQFNTTHTVTEVDSPDTFVIVVSGTSTGTGFAGGTASVYRPNYLWDTGFINSNQLVLSRTKLDWNLQAMSGQSHAGTETPYVPGVMLPVPVNENISTRNPQVVANSLNEASNKSLVARLDLSTDSDYVSPVIDLSRTSMNLISSRIDNPTSTPTTGFNVPYNFVEETDPTDGSALAKHIFEPITLEQPAIGLKVLMGVNRPSQAGVDLYYRVSSAGSSDVVTQRDWVKVEQERPVQSDDDPSIFREYEYIANLDEPFDVYQFKIVFTSESVSRVPRVRDFRGIALGT